MSKPQKPTAHPGLAVVSPANRALVAGTILTVARVWGLSTDQLLAPERHRLPREARAVVALVLSDRGVPPSEIARALGRQTGSAARYGARWARKAVSAQPRLAALVDSVAAEIDAAVAVG